MNRTMRPCLRRLQLKCTDELFLSLWATPSATEARKTKPAVACGRAHAHGPLRCSESAIPAFFFLLLLIKHGSLRTFAAVASEPIKLCINSQASLQEQAMCP